MSTRWKICYGEISNFRISWIVLTHQCYHQISMTCSSYLYSHVAKIRWCWTWMWEDMIFFKEDEIKMVVLIKTQKCGSNRIKIYLSQSYLYLNCDKQILIEFQKVWSSSSHYERNAKSSMMVLFVISSSITKLDLVNYFLVQPRRLVIPEAYTKPPYTMPQRSDLTVTAVSSFFEYFC